MPLLPKCLLGPRHLHPGVNSSEDYRRRQYEVLAKGRARYPHLIWPDPFPAAVVPPVMVADGAWKVRCVTPDCEEFPIASLEWRVARCLNCGAVYEGLVFPEDASEIERVLVNRPHMATRNWNWPTPGETVESLRAENRAHGDPD